MKKKLFWTFVALLLAVSTFAGKAFAAIPKSPITLTTESCATAITDIYLDNNEIIPGQTKIGFLAVDDDTVIAEYNHADYTLTPQNIQHGVPFYLNLQYVDLQTNTVIEPQVLNVHGKVDEYFIVAFGTSLIAIPQANFITTEERAQIEKKEAELQKSIAYTIQNVKSILQLPKYPSGCEPVSATVMLQALGYEISESRFICDYMEHNRNLAKRTSADPERFFVGDITTKNGWCYSGAIEKGINRYFQSNSSKQQALNLSGSSLSELLKYVADDKPVVAYVTVGMKEPATSKKPYKIRGTKDCYFLKTPQHCVCLYGYNENNVFIMDPLEGPLEIPKPLFETRFKQMGQMAVTVADQ